MKSFFLILLAFGFFLQQVNAGGISEPEKIPKDSIPKIGPNQSLGFKEKQHTVWLNIGQLGFMENQISYEHKLWRNLAIESTVGFKFPKNIGEPYNLTMRSIGPQNYYDYIALIPYSTGLLASLSVKNYLSKDQKLYISGSYFYRYWFYNNQQITSIEMDSQGNNNFTSTQSLNMHVHGVKVLLGCIIGRFHFHGNTDMVVDIYTGFGHRSKKAIIEGSTNSVTRKSETMSYQLGLKAGLSF